MAHDAFDDRRPNLERPRDTYHPQAQFTATRPDHEHSDISIKGVFSFVVVLVVAAVAIHIVLWFMYQFMERQHAKSDTPRHALAKQEAMPPEKVVQEFPEPRLQRNEVVDMNQFRRAEEQRLRNYTWLDQNAGKVSIPIDRAMELVLERGLPAADRAPATAPQDKQNQAGPTNVPERRVGQSEGPKTRQQ